jgi:hypothetical protein
MATRSAIGYALPSGNVRAVYCHWDGSPSIQLPVLEEHYNNVRKIQTLIRPGSMSNLRTEETWDSDYQRDEHGKADFDSPRTNLRDPQPLYHRERGIGPWCAGDNYAQPPITVPGEKAQNYWREHGCEFLYVFRPGWGWFNYSLD